VNATEQIAAAIETHGAPKWVAVVPMSVRRQVSAETKRQLLATARVSEGWSRQSNGTLVFGRLDARDTLRQWAAQNIFAVLTVKEIAEQAGVSQSAVRTMISERADIFRKSDGRTYEVRDANADRQADKR
jgi:AraC-like DNA-binding protein